MEDMVNRDSLSRNRELILKLEAAGLNAELAEKIIKSNDLAVKLVALVRGRGFNSMTSQKRAREIMGINYFGIEESVRIFGVNPLMKQEFAVSDVPFSEATLEECKNTHILIAVFPFSILNIRNNNQKLFYQQDWYGEEDFARYCGGAGWFLIGKSSLTGSGDKSWREQQFLLGKNERIPTARLLVYTIIGHYMATGERLFENEYARCSNHSTLGLRISIGFFGSDDGLHIGIFWDSDHRDNLKAALARNCS